MRRWIAALAALVSAGVCCAQTTPTVAAVELVNNPMIVESLGLTIYPPAQARTQEVRVGDQPTVQVLAPDNTWIVNITGPRTTNPEHGLEYVADDIINQLLKSGGTFKGQLTKEGRIEGDFKDSRIRLLERTDTIVVGSHETERFYVLVPAGANEPKVVQGYTIFKISPTRFCIMQLITTEPEFERVRGIYETVIGTSRFADQNALAEGRKFAVRAGQHLLENLDEEDYLAALAAANGPDEDGRWERLSARPIENAAENDKLDYGYRRVKAWAGHRGELNAKRARGAWRGADHQEGYLVQIDARFIEGDVVMDSKGIYFMTPDRDQEAWTLTLAIRPVSNLRAEPDVYTELGARDGADLTVRTEGPGIAPRTVKPVFQEVCGYLTQVERYILAQLMMREQAVADYAFYTWNSSGDPPAVTLMRAELAAPAAEKGYWELTTRPTENQEPQRTALRADGAPVVTVLPDNPILGRRVWEPIELPRLAQIWRDKGLPMN